MSNTKNTLQDKSTNVQVTLTGPVNREQLFKIQEVLRHPSQYRDKIPPNEQPATGECTKSFNKFCPKKVEVNEATIDEVVGFSCFMRKSDAEVVEAIDIYKALGDDIPMDQRMSQLNLHFTIALGKKTGMIFPVDIHNQTVNALYDTGACCSLINYSMYEKLGMNIDKGYQLQPSHPQEKIWEHWVK